MSLSLSQRPVRYASHRLYIGHRYAPKVLVAPSVDGRWLLIPFEKETERTIFVNGPLRIVPTEHHPDADSLMVASSADAELCTIAELQALLDAVSPSAWRLQLPGK